MLEETPAQRPCSQRQYATSVAWANPLRQTFGHALLSSLAAYPRRSVSGQLKSGRSSASLSTSDRTESTPSRQCSRRTSRPARTVIVRINEPIPAVQTAGCAPSGSSESSIPVEPVSNTMGPFQAARSPADTFLSANSRSPSRPCVKPGGRFVLGTFKWIAASALNACDSEEWALLEKALELPQVPALRVVSLRPSQQGRYHLEVLRLGEHRQQTGSLQRLAARDPGEDVTGQRLDGDVAGEGKVGVLHLGGALRGAQDAFGSVGVRQTQLPETAVQLPQPYPVAWRTLPVPPPDHGGRHVDDHLDRQAAKVQVWTEAVSDPAFDDERQVLLDRAVDVGRHDVDDRWPRCAALKVAQDELSHGGEQRVGQDPRLAVQGPTEQMQAQSGGDLERVHGGVGQPAGHLPIEPLGLPWGRQVREVVDRERILVALQLQRSTGESPERVHVFGPGLSRQAGARRRRAGDHFLEPRGDAEQAVAEEQNSVGLMVRLAHHADPAGPAAWSTRLLPLRTGQ